MEPEISNTMIQGFKEFLGMINWIFFFVFVIVAWAINIPRNKKHSEKKWYNVVPTAVWVFATGTLLAIVFTLISGNVTRQEVMKLFITIVFGMAIWKIGIDKLANWFEAKIKIK